MFRFVSQQHCIQKQHLLLLIWDSGTTIVSGVTNSKTTFVTVNQWYSYQVRKIICYSKTTFVTVNQTL